MKERCMLMQRYSCIQRRIMSCRQMMFFSPCPHVKNYYAQLIKQYNWELMILGNRISKMRSQQSRTFERQREFTQDELSQYDGAGGRPAYVAVNGTVYDVSLNATWGGGTHFGMYAGQDLTNQFAGCHSVNMEVLNRLPKVGTLKEV